MKRVHITREGREYGTFLNLEGNFEQKLGSKGWLSSYLSCGFLTQLIQVYLCGVDVISPGICFCSFNFQMVLPCRSWP